MVKKSPQSWEGNRGVNPVGSVLGDLSYSLRGATEPTQSKDELRADQWTAAMRYSDVLELLKVGEHKRGDKEEDRSVYTSFFAPSVDFAALQHGPPCCA